MRIEDAFLFVVLDIASAPGKALVEACRAAVAGGADVIQVGGAVQDEAGDTALREAAAACREEEALLLVTDLPPLAGRVGAHGVHLEGDAVSLNEARAVLGAPGLVGQTVRSRKDALLAVELGPDYLVYEGGAETAPALDGLRGVVSMPVYAGGTSSLAEAEALVAGGMVRVRVAASVLGEGDLTASLARISRCMGRVL